MGLVACSQSTHIRLPDDPVCYTCNAHSMCRAQVSLQAVPQQGCVLVSHPLLRGRHSNDFYQTVVLLCRHSFANGTYGLILNSFLSNDARTRWDDMRGGFDSWQPQHAVRQADLDLARDMPLALQAMRGQSHLPQHNFMLSPMSLGVTQHVCL